MTEETETEVPDISVAPVEYWPAERVIPYVFNHKKHPASQIKTLAESIKKHGLNDPITVDVDGLIISGHGRYEAMKLLGWKKIPLRHLKMLSKPQADKLRIAANRTVGNEYDLDVLQRELRRLADEGEDISDLGLNDKDLSMMLGDLDSMDESKIADDIEATLATFEEDTTAAADKVAEQEMPIAKVFGFKTLPLQAKVVAIRFMKKIESERGVSGAAALLAHMEAVVAE